MKFRPFIHNPDSNTGKLEEVAKKNSEINLREAANTMLLVVCTGMDRVQRLQGHDAGLLRRGGPQVLPLPVAQHLQGRASCPSVASQWSPDYCCRFIRRSTPYLRVENTPTHSIIIYSFYHHVFYSVPRWNCGIPPH